jgi:hypothetical protein
MAIIGTARFTERIKFFDGQQLFASDLQDLEQFNREMRWLHNQSLHQAGVASGYAVAGNKNDREVMIEPGYALDNRGREIVLTQPMVLQVPPVANDGKGNPVYYDLTVSYPADALLKETETRDGVCVSRSAVRLREQPVFCWVELVATGSSTNPNGLAADYQPKIDALRNDLESGARIRLARAEVLNCTLNQPLSVAQRRNAKPAAQPFLWAGRTETNQDWKATVKGFGIEIAVRVDTSVAHFRTPPRYFAHAIGVRDMELDINGHKVKMILDGFVRLIMPSDEIKELTEEQKKKLKPEEKDDRLSFTFSMLIPAILIDRNNVTLDQVKAALPPALKDWYVEWLGIEG